MKKVSENLASSPRDFASIVQNEQDLLDTMKGQVVQNIVVENKSNNKNDKNILDVLGLEFYKVEDDDKDSILSNLQSERSRFSQAWKIINKNTQSKFNKFVKENVIKNKKLLWHGSKNENWWSIVNSGLLLRPNAAITGKMFGNGIYFASKARKSLGYTSINGSYWANGNSNIAYMSLYDVAYGKPFDVYSSGSYGNFNYEKLKRNAGCKLFTCS